MLRQFENKNRDKNITLTLSQPFLTQVIKAIAGLVRSTNYQAQALLKVGTILKPMFIKKYMQNLKTN